jgi:hypothetical protein
MLIYGTHSLTLFEPGASDAQRVHAPEGVPVTILEAGLLLNHGLLAAELLGLDTREAQEAIDIVDNMPEGPTAYDDDDARALAALFSKLIEALDQAVDTGGAPRGPLAERLTSASHIMHSDAGELLFVSHKLPVAELRAELPALQRMLAFAAQEGLWLRIE